MYRNKWIDIALDDIDSAKIMLREKKYNNVCYFSHQAAEKGLKGYLEDNKINPPRIHDLIELVKKCQNIDNQFSKFLQQARILNQFYIPTRYPVAPIGITPMGMPDKSLAKKALNYAEDIVNFCKSI